MSDIEVHVEFPQREVIQANAVVDNEEKTVSEVIISAKPEITGVTASVDNETGTPYVDITETGTGTEFSFDLAFHNLKGDKGEQGEQGEPGQDGQDGTDGTDGQDGFSPIATVEPIQDGAKITITDKDGTTTTNVYNGTDGTDGADGQAATVTVGTTTTGAAGTNASVVNSGTSSAAVFDFVIPRGDKGDKGDKGDTGSQGPQGVQGEQGPQGIQGPKGETGSTGQDGFSPSANVTQSGDITTITITDKNGTTTESIDLSNFGKVKSVNNTPPDANGNVTISVTGGANTDLSNLTATGEAHFQSPLISGTNIKTINNNPILGSGNINTSEIFVATYGTTTYSQITDAIANNKVVICYYSSTTVKDLYILGGYSHAGLTSSTNYCFTTHKLYKPYINYIYVNSSSVWSTATVTNTQFDGQWVAQYSEISTATSKASRTHDLSSYLPSGTGTYEIFVRVGASYGSATAALGVGTSASPWTNRASAIYATNTYVTSNSRNSISYATIPVSNKTLYSEVSAALGSAQIALYGYRRVGTNT